MHQVRVGVSVATNSETAEQEKAVISDICARIGAAAAEDHDPRGAEQVFQEAIQHNPQNVKVGRVCVCACLVMPIIPPTFARCSVSICH